MAAAVLAVLAVLLVLTFLLLGLHLAQAHAETVRAQPGPGGTALRAFPSPPPPDPAAPPGLGAHSGGRRHRRVPPPDPRRSCGCPFLGMATVPPSASP